MQTNVQAVTYNEHYDKLLAPVYTWMAGGVGAAFSRGNNSGDSIPIYLTPVSTHCQ